MGSLCVNELRVLYIDDLTQGCGNFITNALKLPYCHWTKLSIPMSASEHVNNVKSMNIKCIFYVIEITAKNPSWIAFIENVYFT